MTVRNPDGTVEEAAAEGVPSQWTHVAVVHDAQARQVRLYVNGELRATTACWSTSYVPGPFQIGGVGGVDEVRAFFGAVAASSILAMAEQG